MSHTKGVTVAHRGAFLPFPNVHKGACKDQQWHCRDSTAFQTLVGLGRRLAAG